MSFSPDSNFGSVPPPADENFDDKWGTGGLSLEGDEVAPVEAPVVEVEPEPSLEELGERYSVVTKVEGGEVGVGTEEETAAEEVETMTEEEQEAKTKEFSSEIQELLWKGDSNAAEAVIANAKEKGIKIDIRSVAEESIRSILVDISSTTYGKIAEVMNFAQTHDTEPDLQTLYQEELNNRSQGTNPENLMAFMNAAEEQGIEVILDVELVAKGHRDFIESNLSMVTDRKGGTNQSAINNIFIAIDFAKKHGVDLGDVKKLISKRKEEISRQRAENERVGYEYHDYLNEQTLELNLLQAKL